MNRDLKDIDNEILVARAQRGDRPAFGEIYRRHATGVSRALASFAGPDRDQLDDLTHDVFFKVIHHLDSYRPTRPFTHWLYTIALNVGRNHVRKQSKVIPIDPVEMNRGAAGFFELPEDIVAGTLMQLVSRLPGEMRDVVALRVGSDLPYREIAELLEIPEGTARSRMFNAIKALRAQAGIVDRNGRKRHEER